MSFELYSAPHKTGELLAAPPPTIPASSVHFSQQVRNQENLGVKEPRSVVSQLQYEAVSVP